MRPVNWVNVVWLSFAALAGFWFSCQLGFGPVVVAVDKDAGQVWPAWVQAFGSIAAILAAAAIAWWQRHNESKGKAQDEVARARSMAALLYKDFARWRAKSQPRGSYNGVFGVELHSIPQPIYDNIRDLHVMGAASEPATRAIGFSLKAREIGESGTDGVKRYLRTAEDQAAYDGTLAEIQASCDAVLAAFDELLGITRGAQKAHAASSK